MRRAQKNGKAIDKQFELRGFLSSSHSTSRRHHLAQKTAVCVFVSSATIIVIKFAKSRIIELIKWQKFDAVFFSLARRWELFPSIIKIFCNPSTLNTPSKIVSLSLNRSLSHSTLRTKLSLMSWCNGKRFGGFWIILTLNIININ